MLELLIKLCHHNYEFDAHATSIENVDLHKLGLKDLTMNSWFVG